MRCFKNSIFPPTRLNSFMPIFSGSPVDGSIKQLADVLVQQSNAAIHWMRELGIKWEIDSHVVIDGRYYFEPGLVIHPVGGVSGGLGQLGQWREIATRMGVEIRYESRVRAIARQRPQNRRRRGFRSQRRI